MYDPLLKQLILWDRAPASSLLGTARHEGLHQFLDSLMESPPLWFNEGLAEYVAFGKSERGRWNPGAIAQTHLQYVRDLQHDAQFDLRTFLYGSRGAFMKEGVRNYARGWAFMHFLRHTEAGRKIFERSWKAFLSTPSPHKALEQAFEGVDFVRLWAQFKSYASATLR